MASEQPTPSHTTLVGDFSGPSSFAALDPERDLVVLNVGGIRHETLVVTLTKYPETRLGQLALLHQKLDVEEYFFDRNPEVFNAVMDYYRSGELHIPADVCGVVVQRELEYWNIKEMLIEPCCWASYCENIDRQEALASLEATSGHEVSEERMLETATGLTRFRLIVWRLTYRQKTSTYARAYSIVSMMFIFAAIIGCILETVPKLQVQQDLQAFRNMCRPRRNQTEDIVDRLRLLPERVPALHVLDYICSTFFTVELLVRLLSTPRPLVFIRSPVTIIDFIAVIPFYLTIIVNASMSWCSREEHASVVQFVYILRVLRVLRVFQLLALFKPLQILLLALRDSVYELLILFVFTLICMLVFATLVFYAERNRDETKFVNIPIGFYWALITITTVGYGDIVPDSIQGYFVGGACAICGTVIMALTIPILSNNFTLYYTHTRTRDQADVKEKIRQSQQLLQKDSFKKSLIDNSILIAGSKKSTSRDLGAKQSKLESLFDRFSTSQSAEPRLSVSVRNEDGRRRSVAVNDDYMFDKEEENRAVKKIRKSKRKSKDSKRLEPKQPDA